jgi:hypothetical protein
VRALLYLATISARNRFLSALRRARSPRYAAALIAGGLYIWSFLFRPMRNASVASMFLGQGTEMLVTLLTVLTLMGSWVFGADATALAFTQAEVTMLFSAPLSRRRLIGYKLFKAQIAVLINSLIWVFVLGRGSTILPSPLRAISIWVLFSTLSLHRLGAALVRSSWAAHGRFGAKRHRWSIVVFAAIGLALVAGLAENRHELMNAPDSGAFFRTLGRILATAPAIWGLGPFRLVVSPTFATSAAEWSQLIWPALIVLALHTLWVLRTDTEFEEAALEASVERARRLEAMRTRRTFSLAPPRAPTSTISLASHGHPALAIIWKNILCLKRTAQLRVFVGPLAMAIAVGMAFTTGLDTAAHIAVSSLLFAGLLLIFGGRLIRNDLRQDMQHLPLIKALPIAPGQIVLAEVASAALPIAAVQFTLLVISYVALFVTRTYWVSAEIRSGLLIAAPFACLAFNAALITIQNGMAVLFPAWVRLGPVVTTGVEALGQNVLAMIANLVSLGLGMVLPAVVAWAAVTAMGQSRAVSIALAVIIASTVLGLETYGAMRFIGRSLAKAEPLQTA